MSDKRQRLYALLIFLGSGILLFRTIMMLSQGYLHRLVWWAAVLLMLEFLLDTAALLGSIRWIIFGDRKQGRFPLRMLEAAIYLHWFRVLVYIVGRVGPWIDFDVHSEIRSIGPSEWSWFSVIFAGVMATLGVIGVFVVRRLIRRGIIKE